MIIGMPSDAVSQPFSKSKCFELDLKSKAMLAVESNYQEHIEAINLVRSSCSELIIDSARLIVNALSTGNTIFWCGNGGSAADSQHMAAELVGRFRKDRKALRSMLLLQILQC